MKTWTSNSNFLIDPENSKYLPLRAWSHFTCSQPAILEQPYCFWTFKRKIRKSWLRKPLSTYYRQRDVTSFKVDSTFRIGYFVFANVSLKFEIFDAEKPWVHIFASVTSLFQKSIRHSGSVILFLKILTSNSNSSTIETKDYKLSHRKQIYFMPLINKLGKISTKWKANNDLFIINKIS